MSKHINFYKPVDFCFKNMGEMLIKIKKALTTAQNKWHFLLTNFDFPVDQPSNVTFHFVISFQPTQSYHAFINKGYNRNYLQCVMYANIGDKIPIFVCW